MAYMTTFENNIIWGRVSLKSYKFVGSSIYSQKTNTKPVSILATGNFFKRLNKYETYQVEKLVQHHTIIFFKYIDKAIKSWCLFASLEKK